MWREHEPGRRVGAQRPLREPPEPRRASGRAPPAGRNGSSRPAPSRWRGPTRSPPCGSRHRGPRPCRPAPSRWRDPTRSPPCGSRHRGPRPCRPAPSRVARPDTPAALRAPAPRVPALPAWPCPAARPPVPVDRRPAPGARAALPRTAFSSPRPYDPRRGSSPDLRGLLARGGLCRRWRPSALSGRAGPAPDAPGGRRRTRRAPQEARDLPGSSRARNCPGSRPLRVTGPKATRRSLETGWPTASSNPLHLVLLPLVQRDLDPGVTVDVDQAHAGRPRASRPRPGRRAGGGRGSRRRGPRGPWRGTPGGPRSGGGPPARRRPRRSSGGSGLRWSDRAGPPGTGPFTLGTRLITVWRPAGSLRVVTTPRGLLSTM